MYILNNFQFHDFFFVNFQFHEFFFQIQVKNLRNHKRRAHNQLNKDLKCQFCDQYFKSFISRNEHIQNVHWSTSVKCDICDKIIKTTELKRHKRIIHENIRDHKCESCDKAYATATLLKHHINEKHENQVR